MTAAAVAAVAAEGSSLFPAVRRRFSLPFIVFSLPFNSRRPWGQVWHLTDMRAIAAYREIVGEQTDARCGLACERAASVRFLVVSHFSIKHERVPQKSSSRFPKAEHATCFLRVLC